MGIIVKQFDGNSVTPKDDAVVMDLLFSSHGIFNGCGISFLGVNQLMVNSGRMIVKGRQVVITEETIAAQLSSGGTKRGRLYIRIDLSSPTTPAEFLTQVADTLPELTQEEDANYNDGIYEVELCNYDVSEIAISNIVESCPIISGGMDMLSTIEEVMANTEYGKGVDAQVVKKINGNLAKLGGFTPVIDEATGEITGYKTTIGGADTVFPFSKSGIKGYNNSYKNTASGGLFSNSLTYNVPKNGRVIVRCDSTYFWGSASKTTSCTLNGKAQTASTIASGTYHKVDQYAFDVKAGDVVIASTSGGDTSLVGSTIFASSFIDITLA